MGYAEDDEDLDAEEIEETSEILPPLPPSREYDHLCLSPSPFNDHSPLRPSRHPRLVGFILMSSAEGSNNPLMSSKSRTRNIAILGLAPVRIQPQVFDLRNTQKHQK
ncbi:hypothetical protein H101_06677 [Trichophyton interdigitale H6]|nr:hypothetical protein H101_06677 [Trichophyton interdigitale H6]